MYHEIQRLLREGFSLNAVAKAIGMDPRTVKKYRDKNEAGFEAYLVKRKSGHGYYTLMKSLSCTSLLMHLAPPDQWLLPVLLMYLSK